MGGLLASGGSGGSEDDAITTRTDPGVTTDDPDQSTVTDPEERETSEAVDDVIDSSDSDDGIYADYSADSPAGAASGGGVDPTGGANPGGAVTVDVLEERGVINTDPRAGPGTDPGPVPDKQLGIGGVNVAVDDTGATIRGWAVNRTDSVQQVRRAVIVNGQRTQDALDAIEPNTEQNWVFDVDAPPEGKKKVIAIEGTNFDRRVVATIGEGDLVNPPGTGLATTEDGGIPPADARQQARRDQFSTTDTGDTGTEPTTTTDTETDTMPDDQDDSDGTTETTRSTNSRSTATLALVGLAGLAAIAGGVR